MGGAFSVDRHLRNRGLDRWEDGECSIVELNVVVDIYIAVKPRIMVTHDAPAAAFGFSNDSREYGLGWRLNRSGTGRLAFEVRLDATRREAAKEHCDAVGSGRLTYRRSVAGDARICRGNTNRTGQEDGVSVHLFAGTRPDTLGEAFA